MVRATVELLWNAGRDLCQCPAKLDACYSARDRKKEARAACEACRHARPHFHTSDEPCIARDCKPIGPTVTIEWEEPRPVAAPERSEFDSVPDKFRCYSCQVERDWWDYGGTYVHQRVCRHCYSYLDERGVGGLVRWELRHRIQVDGFPKEKPNSLRMPKPEPPQVDEKALADKLVKDGCWDRPHEWETLPDGGHRYVDKLGTK